MVVDGLELQRLRVRAERIGRDRALAQRDLAEQPFGSLVRDDRQPFGHRLADAAGVIEVVVRDHELGQRLAGTVARARSISALVQRLARRRFEHRQVIGELEQDRVGAAVAVQQPDALR